MTEVFLRRLTPSLIPFVRRQHDFRILSIHRPIEELRALLSELNPSGLITEWLPDVTEALLELGLPTVIADTDMQYPGVTSIDVDDWQVGAEAARAFAAAPCPLPVTMKLTFLNCLPVKAAAISSR